MFNKTELHVIRALVTLGQLPEGQYLGAGAIAGRTGAPQNYLGKMLQQLTREGLVTSQRGSTGGFRLARDPASIFLIEVVEPFESMDRWTGCALGLAKCSTEEACPIHERWGPVRDEFLELLQTTSIADLMGDTAREHAWLTAGAESAQA